jgi:hypothetical protein
MRAIPILSLTAVAVVAENGDALGEIVSDEVGADIPSDLFTML